MRSSGSSVALQDSTQYAMQGAHGVAMITENGRLVPWLVVCAIVSGLAVGLSIYAFACARNADREARLLEYYVMELDGKVMRAGIIRPDESWSARKRNEVEQ